ncbi:MAG: type I restriction enzyme HsdR N-terminal domain-containing protein [Dehalococcoidia bacterium]
MPNGETEFLEHAAMVRDYASMNLSEADTRAHLIDPVLTLLGYRGVDALRREVPVAATREFIDYELRAGGEPQALVEAKAVRHAITDQHAAQCVQYASVLGVRWCLITNGVSWTIYDAHAKGALAAKHVAAVRLDSDAQAAAKAWAVLSLFSRDSLARSSPLTKLLIERVIADELARPDSPAINALRRAVKDRFGETVTGQAVLDVLTEAGVEATTADLATNEDSAAPTDVPAQVRKPRREATGARSGLTELVDAGLLPADAALECTLYRQTFAARVRDGGIELQGKLYATPSAAAAALRDGKASNGWVIWKYKGRLLADLRAQLSGSATQPSSAADPS